MNKEYSLDTKDFTKELKLILFLLRTNDTTCNENHGLFNRINWNHFLELAWHHRVYPVLYTKLKEKECGVPTYVLEALRKAYLTNTLQMLKYSAEMEQIGKALDKNKIRALFLKGPVLADDLYRSISLRNSCDLDILVDINDLNSVKSILSLHGYVKDDYILSVMNDWKWRHHHITFFHPHKRIKLEIHWRLNPGPGREIGFDELWERKRVSPITNYPVYFLSREDLFFFLVTHGARHGWSRLRWLVDIDRIINKRLDWIKIHALLKRFEVPYIAGQAIILASQLLKSPITEEMTSVVRIKRAHQLAADSTFYLKQMINLHNLPLSEDVSTFHTRYLFSLMPIRQKFLFIISFLFPYPEDAVTLPLPQNLHFLYFPLRPILWAWRKTRKQAFR